MTTHEPTSPATKPYCVFADHVDRVCQEVDARSLAQAHEIARRQPENWESCGVCESRDSYRLSGAVQDIESGEFIDIGPLPRCTTCGCEIVETVNDSNFGDGECGPCEYGRYKAEAGLADRCRELVAAAESVVANRETGLRATAIQNLVRVTAETKSLLPRAHERA